MIGHGLRVMLFFFMVMGIVPCRAQDHAGPIMLIEEKIFDFQDVEEGTLLEHDFVVKNKGNTPLIIKRVAPG